MQKYKTISTLGDGAFGTVYKARLIKTGETVAIKKMKQKYTNWNECIELREIKSLRKLNHPNVIRLREVLLVAEELYMVFEYLEYNLYEVYSKMKELNKKFTEKQIKSYVYQIAQGLGHMHKNGFFHRDLKPENLLIYNNVTKVCDLGLAREIRSRPPFTDYVSTRWYRAPELLLRSQSYNSPVDVFALGCIIVELYNLCPLFPGTNEIDQLNKIVKVLGTPSKSEWPEGYKLAQAKGYYFPAEKGMCIADLIPDASMEAVDLIESMLKFNFRKRPTIQEILKHQYFRGVVVPEAPKEAVKIVFGEKPEGHKLDTRKEDKNMDIFRQTKRKFKESRNSDAMESSAMIWAKKSENHARKNSIVDVPKKPQGTYNNDLEDLDSLIQELEAKAGQKKAQEVSKLPPISAKEKFTAKFQQPKQSKTTELRHGQLPECEKREPSPRISAKLCSKPPLNKREMFPSKLAYSFNPTLNSALSGVRENPRKNYLANHPTLGHSKLSSIKSQIVPSNLYRY